MARRASRPSFSERAIALAADLAAVVVGWLAGLLVENLAVGVLWGGHFTGAWEVTMVRRVVVPIALAGVAPAAFVMVGWWRVALLAARRAQLSQVALASLGAIAGMTLAIGVSEGRHFASWAARGPFIAAVAAGGGAFGWFVVPAVARSVRGRASRLVTLGVAVAAAGWTADVFALPRLYPAFHVAMEIACLVGLGLFGLGLRAMPDVPRRAWAAVALVVAVGLAAVAAYVPHALRRLDDSSNLRVVLIEHAPLLGRAVELAVRARGPADDEGPAGAGSVAPAASVAPGEVARSLDWTGHDILLVTIDALRADHVSAYGYARPTTPNIDALAGQGALFQAAYCPTPHTSYSVTSLMTGKYLRPLLLLGLGEDSETWAQDLRRYGWRTAAFYPPAVFFIDEDRFTRFEGETLGFEYAKVEFADPELRERQVADYLASAPKDRPLFMWVHFFEPHEPYVHHPDHVFSGGASQDVDAYDGEVATADDGVGRVVRRMRAARPGAVVIVTADHGEEFGEHGGRYHGTTVYEEQVRVPLVVAGPGIAGGARVPTVVQTIDLLPTVLSALGMPRPARLRGRDLGPLLSGKTPPDAGFAFAETDDYALVASDGDRLVCERRAAACSLYRPASDPAEAQDLAAAQPARVTELRAELRAVERDHGRFEAGQGPAYPEALRRGMVGDVEAAADVATLLDDANVNIRRKAAEVCFDLHAPGNAPQLRRAFARDEDDEVRRWAALALVREGDPPPAGAEALLKDPSPEWRRRAALAMGERGSLKACETLAGWWNEVAPGVHSESRDGEPPQVSLDLPHTLELLSATAKAKCRSAVPAMLRSLQDVRARPYVADALGAIGDERAHDPLLRMLGSEPYVTTRAHEAAALLALAQGDGKAPEASADVRGRTHAGHGPQRVVVYLSDAGAELDASVDGKPLAPAPVDGPVRTMDLPPGHGASVMVTLKASTGTIRSFWVVGAGAGVAPGGGSGDRE